MVLGKAMVANLFLSTYHMSGIAKSIFHGSLHSMLTVTLHTKYYYNLHISHEETETQGH